jgi:adenosine deaminase
VKSLIHYGKSIFRQWRKQPIPVPPLPDIPPARRQWLSVMPKVEIHVHFEGGITENTILLLAQKYSIEDIHTPADARRCLTFCNAHQFFMNFLTLCGLFREPDDFYHAALEIGKRYKEEHILYAEITLAPHKFIRGGIAYPDMMQAILAGLQEASPSTSFKFIIDIVRDLGADLGMEMMKIVADHPVESVVAIGLGGSEAFPPQDSLAVYNYATSLGLQGTAHAGEGMGPRSVWNAIRYLKVKRIDHGVRAMEDSKLIHYLAENQIPLNMCLTSNVMLGVVPSIQAHPFKKLINHGVPINLSTDDPTFFNTTLTDEFIRAVGYHGLTNAQITQTVINAVNASFLSENDKQQIKARILQGHEPSSVSGNDTR